MNGGFTMSNTLVTTSCRQRILAIPENMLTLRKGRIAWESEFSSNTARVMRRVRPSTPRSLRHNWRAGVVFSSRNRRERRCPFTLSSGRRVDLNFTAERTLSVAQMEPMSWRQWPPWQTKWDRQGPDVAINASQHGIASPGRSWQSSEHDGAGVNSSPMRRRGWMIYGATRQAAIGRDVASPEWLPAGYPGCSTPHRNSRISTRLQA